MLETTGAMIGASSGRSTTWHLAINHPLVFFAGAFARSDSAPLPVKAADRNEGSTASMAGTDGPRLSSPEGMPGTTVGALPRANGCAG
jgi:hypothetical protein